MKKRKLSGTTRVLFIFSFTYVGIIFLFAGLYSLNQATFYHTTIRYEISYNNELIDIANDIEQSIKNNLYEVSGGEDILDFGDYKISIPDINIVQITLVENFLFKIFFQQEILYTDMNEGFSRKMTTFFEAYIEELFYYGYEDQFITKYFYKVIVEKEEVTIPWVNFSIRDACHKVLTVLNEKEQEEFPLLVINQKLYKRVKSFIDASNGLPENIQGGFFRMLYLSAVTITTLGYGDIIPISDFARFLIAFESILGVVIMGVFVSYLFAELKKES